MEIKRFQGLEPNTELLGLLIMVPQDRLPMELGQESSALQDNPPQSPARPQHSPVKQLDKPQPPLTKGNPILEAQE